MPTPIRLEVESTRTPGPRLASITLDFAAVFGDVGYERATIRGIAAAANVDKSSIIKYFDPTDQDLVCSSHARASAE